MTTTRQWRVFFYFKRNYHYLYVIHTIKCKTFVITILPSKKPFFNTKHTFVSTKTVFEYTLQTLNNKTKKTNR